MPGRQFNSSSYKYGFGGKLKDDEISGSGNSIDFGERLYDPRLGRTPTRDKKANDYAGMSPYSMFANNPIIFIDPDGNDIILYNADGSYWGKYKLGAKGEPMSVNPNSPKLIRETINALNAVHAVDKAGNGGPTPKEVVEMLVDNHDITININVGGDENNKFTPAGENKGNILYDPLAGAEIIAPDGTPTGKKISPTTALAHELKHGLNYILNRAKYNKSAITKTDPEFKTDQEKDATTTTERDVATERKEGTRTTYKKGDTKYFKTKSSTTTEAAEKKTIYIKSPTIKR